MIVLGIRGGERLSEEQFLARLKAIYQIIRQSKTLEVALETVGEGLLDILGVRLFTVYQCVENGKELLAIYRGGDTEYNSLNEIRVHFSATSVAGYVALSQRSILINDVKDTSELVDIHPRLQFDRRFSDERGWPIKPMIAVPIKDEVMLGVLQLINFEGDPSFDSSDLKRAAFVSQMLARQFRESLQSNGGPFDQLVKQGSLSSRELADAQANASLRGASVSSVLMENYSLSAQAIDRSLAHHYRVPFMAYDPALILPLRLLENISKGYLRKTLWLPVAGDKNEAVILIDDPSNHQRIMEIQGVLNARNYVFRVGLPEHISLFLRDDSPPESSTSFEDLFSVLASQSKAAQPERLDDEDHGSETSGMIQLVNRVIAEADRLGASDIHIEPSREGAPGSVRIRVDGLCRQLLVIPEEHCAAAIARVKVISRLNIAERRLPQDGKCKLKLADRHIEMRVATLPTVHGESVVMRLLTPGSPMQLETLSLSVANQREIMTIATQPHGLFLVVGPTGSGKTTTLHAVLSKLNTPERKIWTAEDPVEITQEGLQQVQVQSKINFTFAMAMRAFLRADPDVILIGEMRDKETANIGIEASLTGHLVLSTLHTNSASETITRLLDLGLDPINFSDALLGVLAQRLMRTLCANCKQAYEPGESERLRLLEWYGEEDFVNHGLETRQWTLCKAVGCSECGGTGYKGRMAIHEMLVCGSRLRGLIYRRASLDELRHQAAQDGMRTMRQDGIEKILSGHSDYSQLIQVVGVAIG